MGKIRATAAAAMLAAALLILGGCSGGGEAASPSDALKTFFDALRAQDTETLASVYAGDTGDLDMSSLAEEMSGMDLSGDLSDKLISTLVDFDYEIGAETVEEDSATVEATISSHDMGTVFSEAISAYFADALAAALEGASDEELSAMFTDIFVQQLDTQSEKSHVATTTFNLVQVDGQWKVAELSQDNVDCLLGGIISSVEEIAGSLEELSAA